MGRILVLNSGSSSIKFATYAIEGAGLASNPGTLRRLVHGQVAQHADGVEMHIVNRDGTVLAHEVQPSQAEVFDCEPALLNLIDWLESRENDPAFGGRLVAVGHRVVHGGPRHAAPQRISDALLAELETLCPLAPLHQPRNLKAIEILCSHRPWLTQVACFDTAFHVTQPPLAQAFALPRAITDRGVRRYGFHGLSYEYVSRQLPHLLGDKAQGRVIVAHLGSGASLCAMVGRQSVASTMGFSALDGLMMGSRCGTIDPGVLLYLLQEMHMTPDAVSDLLYRRSGLLGVSGLSSDMQVLLASDSPAAAEAVALFNYRVAREIGSLAAAMGGLDALVFTGGIGEHAAPVRAAIAGGCAWLGAELDANANQGNQARISTPNSALLLAVTPTDEELVIAEHTLGLLGSA